MQLICFWMARGHDPNKLANLTFIEKQAYALFMQQIQEDEIKRHNAMFEG